ncbi:MAG: hypothetical protein H0V30_10515 [Chitinophagaceae bacterium]|nr:hypothetical protein [Chitinophagaceae bacterium]
MEKGLVKKALAFFYDYVELHNDWFVFHDYRQVSESVRLCKEIARGEGLAKEDYESGLVALILSHTYIKEGEGQQQKHLELIDEFLEQNKVSDNERKIIRYFADFYLLNKTPQNTVENVLRDAKDIHLGLPDALERLSLLRIEEERVNKKTYSELEWLLQCKYYFIMHSFDTPYANRVYGSTRNKNFIELEKRIDKFRAEEQKDKKYNEEGFESLSAKESQDLFRIAFRNYLDLVALADRKAGLLIQVNSILAPVVVAFSLRRIETHFIYTIPTACVLIGAVVTIFYGILASKPLEKNWDDDDHHLKERFFFGSFDRLDPGFKKVTWEKYSDDMYHFFRGDKKLVFEDLIKESYAVRKVLSKKFGYLTIAYKVFFAGLMLSIVGYLAIAVFDEYQKMGF